MKWPRKPSPNCVSESERTSLKSDEHLTSEMREQIIMELRREWYNYGEVVFGYAMKRRWTSGWNETIIDSSTMSRDAIDSMQLRKFCNKPTALYWAHSAQINDICPRLVFGCIHREWFRCHDNQPRMDFELFFANPVRITSTGPTTISDILEAHKYFYNQTSSLLEKTRRDEIDEPHSSFWPDPRNFKLLPVCRALIMILDELSPSTGPDPDGFISLDNELQRQSVLMVRTGEESHLSEPISFENVKEEALPLARPDIKSYENTDAVRVVLAIAVRFVVDLQRREELAIPESALSSTIDQSLCPLTQHTEEFSARTTNVDEWIDRIMKMADQKGIEDVRPARDAVARVKAVQRGESHLADLGAPHFDGRWR